LCLDSYNIGFYGRSPIDDPLNSDSGDRSRVIRGGGFSNKAANARSANRHSGRPGLRGLNLGLRPAKGIAP